MVSRFTYSESIVIVAVILADPFSGNVTLVGVHDIAFGGCRMVFARFSHKSRTARKGGEEGRHLSIEMMN